MIELSESYSMFADGIAIGILLTAAWYLLAIVIQFFWDILRRS